MTLQKVTCTNSSQHAINTLAKAIINK